MHCFRMQYFAENNTQGALKLSLDAQLTHRKALIGNIKTRRRSKIFLQPVGE